MADDGYVLEWRNFDAGKNMFGSNADRRRTQPRFMWDEKKVGYKSITADAAAQGRPFPDPRAECRAIRPECGLERGRHDPDYVLSRDDAKGSAADNKAIASWKDGIWTVVIVRPLGLANDDDKAFKEGGVYNVGFAVHDDNITTRGHHRVVREHARVRQGRRYPGGQAALT